MLTASNVFETKTVITLIRVDLDKRKIGLWTLIDKLGEGGNATVWSAIRNSTPDPVALKVLRTKRPDREPYRRFVREIEVLRNLRDPGVLSLIDFSLPEKPSSKDRPWLAMPIATPLTEALSKKGLEDVVGSLAVIAETLARLKTKHGIAHRDIKPGNLYELQGKWLVGDFGLVSVPDLEELTKTGKPLGPAYFTAYELIRDPMHADPHAADVFSFGKTLWVLATGQNFPPQGHQPAATRDFSISDLRPHPRGVELDQLVDRCTRLHPQERPTMEEVATDLRSWITLVGREPVVFDVSDLSKRLRTKLEREISEEDLLEQRRDLAHAAVRQLQELSQPLNEVLRQAHPRPEIDVMDDRLVQNHLKTPEYAGGPDIVFRWQRSSRISAGAPFRKYMLRLGRGLELYGDGTLVFLSMLDVGPDGVMSTDYSWMSDTRKAPVGSIEASRMLEEGMSELQSRLLEALEVFVEKIPEARPRREPLDPGLGPADQTMN